jgi:plastocyanin
MLRRVVPILVFATLAVGVLVQPAFSVGNSKVVIVLNTKVCAATRQYCFAPDPRTVPAGTKMTWTNLSPAPHTITRCTLSACGVGGGTGIGSIPASGTVVPGGQYKATFTSPGTYVYYCKIHGYHAMHGTIIVQ